MSERLERFLRKIVSATEDDYQFILSHFEEKSIPKKKHLYISGEICKQVSYCEQGCFRNYYINEKGEEIIVNFIFEDHWMGDFNSLMNKQPTQYNIQALEDSIVYSISYTSFQLICDKIPAFGAAYQQKKDRNHVKVIDKLSFEKYATAEEKYTRMLNEYPGIMNRVPSLYIASYMGIQPESLSRLRRKLTGKNS